MFECVLQVHNVFSSLLDCLRAFGLRFDEDSRIRDGFYCGPARTSGRSCHFVNIIRKRSYDWKELCYTLRYYEENGRASGNPWSLRQTAVYQKYDRQEDRWTWFLIQPSHSFLSQLESSLRQDATCQSRCTSDPLFIHKMCLTLGLSSFGEYVDAVHSDVVQLV